MNLRRRISAIKTTFYRRPRDEIQRLHRWGPRAYFRLSSWQAEMAEAARHLPPPVLIPGSPSTELWFLTGARFWYQTAFCAWTYANQTGRDVTLHLIDDGTLTDDCVAALRRLFPNGSTVRQTDVADRLNQLLPRATYPVLRQRWTDYINIRKLIDVHLGNTGRKLVLDSDMLFLARPDTLIDWIDGASPRPALMTDCEESYGYSRVLMQELCGHEIPPLLNVGICGLRSESLDWAELENWCQALVEREGTSYYLEQALVAMIAARHGADIMPVSDYITFPSKSQTLTGAGVLQHFVADSKPWYFGHAWRQTLAHET